MKMRGEFRLVQCLPRKPLAGPPRERKSEAVGRCDGRIVDLLALVSRQFDLSVVERFY